MRQVWPTSWWGWAFRFAAGADKAAGMPGGVPTARYLDDAAANAVNAAQGQINWFENRRAHGDEGTAAFALAWLLTRKDMKEDELFSAGHGRAFMDLRDKKWAKLDAGVVKLTRLGSAEMLRRGVVMQWRAKKPGPIKHLWDDEIQEDDGD